jgi:hypothetical protein
MANETATVDIGDRVEKMFSELQGTMAAYLKELKEFKIEVQKRFENQDHQMTELRSQLRSTADPLQKQIEDQQRDLEKLALEVMVGREHRRREAGVGPYRRPPVPPDTETDGNGHSTYPWKQRSATPRPG